MKVGIDIENINRFEKLNNEQFLNKYFTEYEKAYSQKKGLQTIAGLFSCKEAILKAFGVGIGNGIALKNISILHDKNGKPYVEQNETLQSLKQIYKLNECEISISHTKDIVESICILL